MTHTNEQERAEFLVWVRTHEECHEAIDEGSAWAAWQASSRAPVVPHGWKLVPVEPTLGMCESAKNTAHAGLSVFKWADGYNAMLAAAPQPPEAAPVQMPEPWGVAVGDRIWVGKAPAHVPKIAEHESLPLQKLYTEQQVRDLLEHQT